MAQNGGACAGIVSELVWEDEMWWWLGRLEEMRLLSVFLLVGSMISAAGVEVVLRGGEVVVRVGEGELRGRMRVVSLPGWTGVVEGEGGVVVYEGEGLAEVSLERESGGRDLLYRRFVVEDLLTGERLGEPQWVTGFEAIERRGGTPFARGEKKGLAAVVALEDAAELGVRHLAKNVTMGMLLEAYPQPGGDYFWQEVDGERVAIKAGVVRRLDGWLRQAAEMGASVTVVFYNVFDRGSPADDPRVHPATDRAGAPMSIGALNVVTEAGMRTLRAALVFLAERYVKPGLVHGLVVGNEVNSHWVWHNQGEATVAEVVRDYAVAVRVADLATRSVHADFRVYVSLEHHWGVSYMRDAPLKTCGGRELVERFNAVVKAGGNFPWSVAFHPYPENLRQPDFWDDRSCFYSLDTPRISFKNLEVLTAFLGREEMRFKGKVRRVGLTEQGFNYYEAWGKQRAEAVQAAAWALAYEKVRGMEGVETFIHHRHVDARGEGGLKLGFRPEGMGEKRRIWEVFQAAGTDREALVFNGLKDIVGEKKWAEVAVVQPVVESMRRQRDAVVFDFVARRDEAVRDDVQLWQRGEAVRSAGWLAPTLYQHPWNRKVARAVWEIELPRLAAGERLVLGFATWLGDRRGRVEYEIGVEGEQVFAATVEDAAMLEREVDLTRWAGKAARVVFSVDPLGGSGYDQAHWVGPVIEKLKE